MNCISIMSYLDHFIPCHSYFIKLPDYILIGQHLDEFIYHHGIFVIHPSFYNPCITISHHAFHRVLYISIMQYLRPVPLLTSHLPYPMPWWHPSSLHHSITFRYPQLRCSDQTNTFSFWKDEQAPHQNQNCHSHIHRSHSHPRKRAWGYRINDPPHPQYQVGECRSL